MLIQFEEHNFRRSSYELINKCNETIADYQARGYSLTLRQLYYRLVGANVITNKERSYKNLGNLVRNARMAGLISWTAIEDRTRSLRGVRTWDSPADCLGEAYKRYAIDMWESQPKHVEVWVEKDALVSVIGQACQPWRVDHFSCRGYTSLSEMFVAGYYRFRPALQAGREVVIVHLGDHDPSGIDMTRDIDERLNLFSGGTVSVRRVALNMNQVEEMRLPPNPAKMTDSRVGAYIDLFGRSSWELDAIDPDDLVSIIRAEVERHVDKPLWELMKRKEAEEIEKMRRLVSFLDDNDEDEDY